MFKSLPRFLPIQLASLFFLFIHSANAEPLAGRALAPLETGPNAALPEKTYSSIVRIEVATQVPNYNEPWKAGRFSGGIGTGY